MNRYILSSLDNMFRISDNVYGLDHHQRRLGTRERPLGHQVQLHEELQRVFHRRENLQESAGSVC